MSIVSFAALLILAGPSHASGISAVRAPAPAESASDLAVFCRLDEVDFNRGSKDFADSKEVKGGGVELTMTGKEDPTVKASVTVMVDEGSVGIIDISLEKKDPDQKLEAASGALASDQVKKAKVRLSYGKPGARKMAALSCELGKKAK